MLALAMLLAAVRVAQPPLLYPDRAFEPMRFGTPGTTEMGLGYCAKATPFDPDGDGDWDIASGGGSYMGDVYRFYENPGAPRGQVPVFKAGVTNRFCIGHFMFAQRDDGGYTLAHSQGRAYSNPDGSLGSFADHPLAKDNIHWTRVRCNCWRLRDFDGDGADDLVVGVGDWREYGWDNAYSSECQAWTNANARGLVYWLKNQGTTAAPKYAEPRLIRIESGQPIETMANPCPVLEDFDGDGDLDFFLADFTGVFTYFENIGTRTNPVYTSGRVMHDSTGKLLAAPECIPVPQGVDLDRDGLIDIVAAQEDSRVAFYRNTGKLQDRLPVFEPAVFLRCERDWLHFGILTSPYAVDYDGDGDQDLVVGDAAGYLAWFENVSGPGVDEPKWEGPHYLECEELTDGYRDLTLRPDTFRAKPFQVRAGYNGSIQGPIEAGFGYTCETVADWDGDGDLDIMYNHIWGKPMLLENIGTRTRPRYAAPRGIEVEWGADGQPLLDFGWLTPAATGNPKEIVTQWRTTPVMFDLNRDGLMDLMMCDTEGYLAFFERYRDAAGQLRLKAPRRAIVDDRNGQPIGIAGWHEGNGHGRGGNSGRRKVAIGDWDGDGLPDLIMNGMNVVLWKQVPSSSPGEWRFRREGEFVEKWISAHSVCPTLCDFDGDGISDVIVGIENGVLYRFRNPRK